MKKFKPHLVPLILIIIQIINVLGTLYGIANILGDVSIIVVFISVLGVLLDREGKSSRFWNIIILKNSTVNIIRGTFILGMIVVLIWDTYIMTIPIHLFSNLFLTTLFQIKKEVYTSNNN